jgi:hypothetical protein
MSLTLRRNLPLLIMLLGLLAVLALVWGDQPIIAYTAATDSGSEKELERGDSDTMSDADGAASPLATLTIDATAMMNSSR